LSYARGILRERRQKFNRAARVHAYVEYAVADVDQHIASPTFPGDELPRW